MKKKQENTHEDDDDIVWLPPEKKFPVDGNAFAHAFDDRKASVFIHRIITAFFDYKTLMESNLTGSDGRKKLCDEKIKSLISK